MVILYWQQIYKIAYESAPLSQKRFLAFIQTFDSILPAAITPGASDKYICPNMCRKYSHRIPMGGGFVRLLQTPVWLLGSSVCLCVRRVCFGWWPLSSILPVVFLISSSPYGNSWSLVVKCPSHCMRLPGERQQCNGKGWLAGFIRGRLWIWLWKCKPFH